jgi:hypothetical protein
MVAAPMFGQLDLVKRNLTALDTVKAMKELKVRDTAINVLIQKHTGFPYTKTLEKDSITLWSYYRGDTYKYFTIDTFYSGIQLGYGGMHAGFAGAIDEEGPRNALLLQSITGIHHITHDSTGFHYTSNPDTAGWGNRSKNYFVTAPWVLDRIASGGTSGGSGVVTATVTLTSAQLINNTPVEIVPAQATGKMAVPLNVVLKYNHGTTNYTSNEFGIVLLYGTTPAYSVFTQSLASFLMSTTSKIAVCDLGFGGDESIITNAALNVKNNTADTADGDGTLTVIVSYMVIDI